MIYLEAYKDFIKQGSSNKVTDIDNDWILKTPLKAGEGDHGLDNMSDILDKFNHHIETMKKYPQFFPEIKKLDKYRAAIKKMNTIKAKEEINYIYYELYNLFPKRVSMEEFFDYIIIEQPKYLNILNQFDNTICKKWCHFLISLKNSKLFKENGYLDLHNDNFGIDKEGNIKLLDF